MKKDKSETFPDLRFEVQHSMLEQIVKQCFKDAINELNDLRKKPERIDTPLLTIGDVAKRFKVTKTTVQNWIRRGTITGQKLGKNRYFTEQELTEAMAKYGWGNLVED